MADEEKDIEVEDSQAEIENLRQELQKTKEEAEGYITKLKYLMADFDNYRKQADRQVVARVEAGKAELLLKFLGIRDDYERALATAKKSSSPEVAAGLEGILKNIDSLLAGEGVMPIEAVDTPFDPRVHDAVAFLARDDVPDESVTAELRRGYMLNGKVLRPSMVEVARKISKGTDEV
jgi:molecular chaperone GrpE